MLYPDFIRSLDVSQPNHAAMVVACTRLLRGSGYVGFNGELPEQAQHSALASEYAHVTAPLRRLVDRYALEICVALCAGEEVPGLGAGQARATCPTRCASRGAGPTSTRTPILNLVEAAVLAPRVGESFPASSSRSTRRTTGAAT